MNQKKELKQRLRYCVLICESLYSDYDSTSPFSEVGNYAAIDYTLNWLSENNFEEVFLFYSSLKKEIQQYCQNYAKCFDIKIRLNFMKTSELKNFGDVMREVNFRDLVSQDFLVLYADTLTNLDLSQVIDIHFTKKVDLKNVVLTTAMRRAQSPHLIALNATTNEILQIEENGKQFNLNVQKINLKKLTVDFRTDLVAADLFICTIEVLKSFKQNQEYITMHDFIIGMLTSEVYEQKIIVYELKPQQIFLRVNKASTTYLTYMNYLSAYLYPYSPYSQDTLSRIQRAGDKLLIHNKYHKIYRKGAKVADSTYLSNNVYIGQNSKIQPDCTIQKSIIGKGCSIGKKSVLKHCVVLDEVILAENSNFEYCLLEKVNQTLKIHNFKGQMFEMPLVLIERELFQTTPEAQQITFEEQLKQLLDDKPQQETILVSELVRIRKQFQKSEGEFTRQVLKSIAPKGVKGIQTLTDQWGSVLLKVHHQQESQLIDSLYFACTGLEEYSKAFHVFLQYFYHYEVLKKQNIIEWVNPVLNDNPSPTIKLCAAFLQKLEVESEEQQDDEEN